MFVSGVIKNVSEIKIVVHLHRFLAIKRQIPGHFDPENICIDISRITVQIFGNDDNKSKPESVGNLEEIELG
jgi:hypothetical protein